MNKKIKVRIKCSERVRYDQTVEMTRDEWAELKSTKETLIEDSMMSPLAEWLNMRDPNDTDGFCDIEIEVVDENKKPVVPEDCYEGGE